MASWTIRGAGNHKFARNIDKVLSTLNWGGAFSLRLHKDIIAVLIRVRYRSVAQVYKRSLSRCYLAAR